VGVVVVESPQQMRSNDLHACEMALHASDSDKSLRSEHAVRNVSSCTSKVLVEEPPHPTDHTAASIHLLSDVLQQARSLTRITRLRGHVSNASHHLHYHRCYDGRIRAAQARAQVSRGENGAPAAPFADFSVTPLPHCSPQPAVAALTTKPLPLLLPLR
jgi:hypothetical protein